MSEYVRLAEVEDGYTTNRHEAVGLTIVYNSMLMVRQGMLVKGFDDSGAAERKPDGTFVTAYDKESERIGNLVMTDMAPALGLAMRFRGEEGTRSGKGELEAGEDPLDGTRNYVVGATDATVLLALYNGAKEVVGAAIGQPSTGKILSAFGEGPAELRLMVLDGDIGRTARYRDDVTTWKGSLKGDDRGQMFIDNNLPFDRNGHTVMTQGQHIALRAALTANGIGDLELGGNGAHQFSVAAGNERSGIALTTARGVWEDTTAGLFLTEKAGGSVQRYTTVEGVFTPVGAEVLEYDTSLAANTESNLDLVHSMLMRISVDPETLRV